MASSSVPSPLITPTPALPPASSLFPLPWRERGTEERALPLVFSLFPLPPASSSVPSSPGGRGTCGKGLFPWCFLCFLSPRHLLRSSSSSPPWRREGQGEERFPWCFVPSPLAGEGQEEGGGLSFRLSLEGAPPALLIDGCDLCAGTCRPWF